MSQEQQQRPQYGDVFNVSGELASQSIAPRDASTMQAAENTVLGETQKGAPAAVMQSSATYNKRAGLLHHRDATDATREEGVTVSESINLDGNIVVTERIAGQVINLRSPSTYIYIYVCVFFCTLSKHKEKFFFFFSL